MIVINEVVGSRSADGLRSSMVWWSAACSLVWTVLLGCVQEGVLLDEGCVQERVLLDVGCVQEGVLLDVGCVQERVLLDVGCVQ